MSLEMENTMRLKLTAAAAFAGVAMAALATAASAVPLVATGVRSQANQSLAQPVDYRNYCGRWRAECSDRYPARGWRYRRCLSYHGCL